MSNPPSSRKVRCPQCGQEAEYSARNPFRPFCSERCRLIDLGEWASENFRVPTQDESAGEEKSDLGMDESTED